jgi:hypothetical protein
MPQPILCLDEEVYHFAKRFDALSHTTASATGSPTVAPQSLNRGKNRDKSLLRIILVVLLSSMIIGLAVFLFTRSGTVCPTLTGVSSNTLKSYSVGTYTNTKYGGPQALSFDTITEDQQTHYGFCYGYQLIL